MTRSRGTSAFVLLAALLMAGQAAAALHAFNHDLDSLPGKTCSTCITAAQLGTAATGDAVANDLAPVALHYSPVVSVTFRPRQLPAVCGRGPPSPGC